MSGPPRPSVCDREDEAVKNMLLTLSSAALGARVATPPLWATIPACRSEAELARAAPFMIPPRRVRETHVDGAGKSTEGRCLPYSLMMELTRQSPGEADAASKTLPSIHAFRDDVLDFAVQHQSAAWGSDGCVTLGDVITTIASNRGWSVGGIPRAVTAQIWAAKLKSNPRDGCDAAFLFACAARHGLRIHVHYQPQQQAGWIKDTQFAVPPSADREVLLPPRTDVHVGFVDNGTGGFHYVALPPILG